MAWTSKLLSSCILALAAVYASAQTPSTVPDAELHALSRQAGVIFTGQVAAVRRLDATGGATGVVEIDFTVDAAVRGVRTATYTLREWAGAWPAGDAPFRVGQRYLMLLHAPGPSGLSSPVGGPDGAIPIHGPAAGGAIDLRWVATRAVRPVIYAAAPQPTHPIARPLTGHANLVIPMASSSAPIQPEAPSIAASSATQQAAYASVLTLLRGWEREDNAQR